MSRRPNFLALALSTMLIAAGLAGALGWRPVLPGLGMMQTGAASNTAVRRPAPPWPSQCDSEPRAIHGGYRFLPHCRGQAPSFDRQYYVVKNAGIGTGVGLVRGGSGESLDDLDTLDSGLPFTLFWSPGAHRLFANIRRDGEDVAFRMFEVRSDRLVERRSLDDAARAQLRTRRPCLTTEDIVVSGIRWSRDGRRIALLATARRSACGGFGTWRPVWMIGDSRTGQIDPLSVRIRHGRSPLPADGPYATL